MREEFNNIISALKNANISRCEGVYGRFTEFCPYIQFVKLDALKREDWENNIAENSVYVTFKIDLLKKKVEIHSCGHVWISKADKETYPMDYYMAMHSLTKICKRNGVKPMRKSSYKSVDNLVEKIIKAYETIMEQVADYTGGYPYKEGVKALKSA